MALGLTPRRLGGDTHVAVKPPAHAIGWYAVALERELKSGSLITRKLAGREITLFRTEDGKVVAAEPYCPHHGAHIGRSGKVQGELVVCPFHGFKFNTTSACVNTPYDPPPGGASLKTLPVFIYLDVIMVHHGLPNKPAPSAPELPALDRGWGRVKFKRMHTKTYHQLSLPTPADRREADMIVGIVVHKRATSGWARTIMIPVECIVRAITLELIMSEYRRDFKIWESKVYLDHPKLTRDEGSIGKFRQWARRLYLADPLDDGGPPVGAIVNDKEQVLTASSRL